MKTYAYNNYNGIYRIKILHIRAPPTPVQVNLQLNSVSVVIHAIVAIEAAASKNRHAAAHVTSPHGYKRRGMRLIISNNSS